MARIAGVDIPDRKRGEIALTYIFGVGRRSAQTILTKAEVDWNKVVSEWNDDEANAIRAIIAAEFRTEGVLKSEVQMSIKRLMDIGCYRGLRHKAGLPTRGQNTKSNARTKRGKKSSISGGTKKPVSK